MGTEANVMHVVYAGVNPISAELTPKSSFLSGNILNCGMSAIKPIPIQEAPLVDASNARKKAILIRERSKWAYYNKPVTLIVTGVLLFLSGIGLSALYFAQAEDVPSALGPACLSIGLMFFVTGMVWLPIVKQAIRYDGLLSKSVSVSSA